MSVTREELVAQLEMVDALDELAAAKAARVDDPSDKNVKAHRKAVEIVQALRTTQRA